MLKWEKEYSNKVNEVLKHDKKVFLVPEKFRNISIYMECF
jgi:hypothetical protein